MTEPPDPEFVQAVAHEVAKLLREPPRLLTATQVAMQLGVSTGWVYDNADDLGVIRLGAGPKPRLRFHPNVIAQRLAQRPEAASQPAAYGRVPLLPIGRRNA